jgi:hypothetical protein
MSQPPIPPPGGPAPFPQPDGSGEPAVAPYPGTQWTAPPVPSWSQPWEPPMAPAVPGPPLAGTPLQAAPSSSSRLVLVLVAVVAALVGAVAAGFLVTAVFLGGAKDIGQEIGAAVEDSVSSGISEGMSQAMEDAMSLAEQGIPSEQFAPTGPVEQFPATEPGDLGPDPVLDAYADSCFGGDLQACDDLYNEAPPLSEYEAYGWSCGGRVKAYTTSTCTELD